MRCSADDLLPSTVRIEGYPTFDGIRSVSARTALMRRRPVGCQVKFDWQARVPGLRFAYLQASDCSLARIVRLRRGSPSPGQLADPAREARLGSRPGPRLQAVMACARPPSRHAGVPAGGARRRLSRRSRPYSPLRPGALSAATPKLRAAGATARAAECVDFGDAERGPAEPAAGELRAACKKWRDPNAPGKKKNPASRPAGVRSVLMKGGPLRGLPIRHPFRSAYDGTNFTSQDTLM